MTFPLARRQGLLVQELADETLIYAQTNHRAHCLNRTAAQVWRHCDGKTSVAELAQAVGGDQAIVETALADLAAAGLLENCPPVRRLTRRALVAKVGAAMLMAPVVMSIAAPRAMAQASPGPGPGPDGGGDADGADVPVDADLPPDGDGQDISDVAPDTDTTDVDTTDVDTTDASDLPDNADIT